MNVWHAAHIEDPSLTPKLTQEIKVVRKWSSSSRVSFNGWTHEWVAAQHRSSLDTQADQEGQGEA